MPDPTTTAAVRCPRCGATIKDTFDAMFHAIRKDGEPLCRERDWFDQRILLPRWPVFSLAGFSATAMATDFYTGNLTTLGWVVISLVVVANCAMCLVAFGKASLDE